MIRKLYYNLSPRLRFLVRRLWFLPADLLRNRESLAPPKGLIYTGRGDFIKQGLDWKTFFVSHHLSPDAEFLDIGSGIGRIALGLTGYLKGNYEGFEAMKVGADWCQENITNRFPNFLFKYIPLHNDLYNSDGIDASTFEFPYLDKSFDFACSISVFSHMTDLEIENYLVQCHRVLKQSGKLVATFFISDEVTRVSTPRDSDFNFRYNKGHYSLMDDNTKGANVCFDREYLFTTIEKTGFRIIHQYHGQWSGRTDSTEPLAFQDILVLEKI